MENKINIAQLLKDCPKGMELDCTICNGVKFIELDRNPNFPIVVRANNGYEFSLTKYGQVHNIDDARCVIYPKGKTTWEGFVPSCKFKDGDIIFTHANCLKVGLGNTWISIYQENRNGGVATYVDYAEDGSDYYSDIDGDKALLCMEKDILRQRLATEEEKQKLFKAIKEHGYKWNEETKTLEKLVKPKFKVGDRIRKKGENSTFTITDVNEAHYFCGKYVICDTCDNNWELVPYKFDINTLVPFESRVLVRLTKDNVWNAAFFSHYDKEVKWGCYPFVTTSSKSYLMCIPYEGNEHLLGKTDDCSEFYKNW